MTYRKKLIEVALPLEAINREAAREKSIRHGHPSTLHLWWARRPLAACRAVLFAALVDDPASRPEEFPTEEAQNRERERLFGIIKELVKWENINDERVLELARREIMKSTDGQPPPVLDPFAGGGSIPLEAQRLGLKAYASDLNPVAVLINKAMIEIPPRFAGQPPVNPETRRSLIPGQEWRGAAGLAEDVRYYGEWMRTAAEERIGHLYPKVPLPPEQGGGEATVIAWLWARTVRCPNPACGATMPLARSFWLSKKKGKKAWVEPRVDREHKTVEFTVKTGQGIPPDGTVNRRGAQCIVCGAPVPFDHVRGEGKAGRMGAQMMAIVAEGNRRRIYLPPIDEHIAVAGKAEPTWEPKAEMQGKAAVNVPLYGMNTFADLFTPRQLTALTTFSDLVGAAREQVYQDARAVGWPVEGDQGAGAYADAVATYLGLSVSRSASMWSSLCWWQASGGFIAQVFTRQAIPMIWDFAEVCPFSHSTGNWISATEWITRVLKKLPASAIAHVRQRDAAVPIDIDESTHFLISTDPPYYDNVEYADLSDFYYVWQRKIFGSLFPNLFSTLLTPKMPEIVASSHRFSDKATAEEHFLTGLEKAFQQMHNRASIDYPVTIYYAFKQAEKSEGTMIFSTGWETMLEGLITTGFQITGTIPIQTERPTGVKVTVNALASSIVLVCRPRPADAPEATRREFSRALRRELPPALRKLQQGNIAPVDLAQAAIGPGMAIFSRYRAVWEVDGGEMTVRTALQLINQELDAYFAEQEGDFDAETRFCVAWFEQYGTTAHPFGEAEVLAKAKNVSVEGMARAGLLEARGGKVRLLRRVEYTPDWDPTAAHRVPVWKGTQYLIRALEQEGEGGAARVARALGGAASAAARALAYRLYAICERQNWAQPAIAYNVLVTSWDAIQEKVGETADATRLF